MKYHQIIVFWYFYYHGQHIMRVMWVYTFFFHPLSICPLKALLSVQIKRLHIKIDNIIGACRCTYIWFVSEPDSELGTQKQSNTGERSKVESSLLNSSQKGKKVMKLECVVPSRGFSNICGERRARVRVPGGLWESATVTVWVRQARVVAGGGRNPGNQSTFDRGTVRERQARKSGETGKRSKGLRQAGDGQTETGQHTKTHWEKNAGN